MISISLIFAVSYQILCEAMDNFYVKAGKVRMSMGLPEKEFAVEIQQEEGKFI